MEGRKRDAHRRGGVHVRHRRPRLPLRHLRRSRQGFGAGPGLPGREHADTSARTVERLLASRNLTNARILEGVFPEETGPLVEGSNFRLCHVDMDVYRSARDAAEWLWPRLVPGGMVVYDDYGFEGCAGVTRYVDEQASGPDRVVVRNLNGHAVVVKTG